MLVELPQPAVKQVGGSCTRVDRPRALELGAHEGAPRTAAIKAAHEEQCSAACQNRSLNWQRRAETRDLAGALQRLESGRSMIRRWTTWNQENLTNSLFLPCHFTRFSTRSRSTQECWPLEIRLLTSQHPFPTPSRERSHNGKGNAEGPDPART